MKRTRRIGEIVKTALLACTEKIMRRQKKEPCYTIKPVKGYPRRTDLDCIGEVLAQVEGEDYK